MPVHNRQAHAGRRLKLSLATMFNVAAALAIIQ